LKSSFPFLYAPKFPFFFRKHGTENLSAGFAEPSEGYVSTSASNVSPTEGVVTPSTAITSGSASVVEPSVGHVMPSEAISRGSVSHYFISHAIVSIKT